MNQKVEEHEKLLQEFGVMDQTLSEKMNLSESLEKQRKKLQLKVRELKD